GDTQKDRARADLRATSDAERILGFSSIAASGTSDAAPRWDLATAGGHRTRALPSQGRFSLRPAFASPPVRRSHGPDGSLPPLAPAPARQEAARGTDPCRAAHLRTIHHPRRACAPAR